MVTANGCGPFQKAASGMVCCDHVDPLFAEYAKYATVDVLVDMHCVPAQTGVVQTDATGIAAADHVEPPLLEYAAAVEEVVRVAVQ